MGFESRIRFEINPLVPEPYAPHRFLLQLDTDPPSLECSHGDSSPTPLNVYEYRVRGVEEAWPAVTISIEQGGFLQLEQDRRIGARLLGPLVRYAMSFARDERVTVESV